MNLKDAKNSNKHSVMGLDLRSVERALGTTLQFPERGISCIKEHILKDYKDFDKLIEFDPYKNKIGRAHV